MKKLLLLTILITYATASFGVRFQYFYCCGNLKSVSLSFVAAQGDSSQTSTSGCCQHKTISVKLTTDQSFSQVLVFKFSPADDFALLPPQMFQHVFPKIPAEDSAVFAPLPPLITSGLPLYRLYQVYLI